MCVRGTQGGQDVCVCVCVTQGGQDGDLHAEHDRHHRVELLLETLGVIQCHSNAVAVWHSGITMSWRC